MLRRKSAMSIVSDRSPRVRNSFRSLGCSCPFNLRPTRPGVRYWIALWTKNHEHENATRELLIQVNLPAPPPQQLTICTSPITVMGNAFLNHQQLTHLLREWIIFHLAVSGAQSQIVAYLTDDFVLSDLNLPGSFASRLLARYWPARNQIDGLETISNYSNSSLLSGTSMGQMLALHDCVFRASHSNWVLHIDP